MNDTDDRRMWQAIDWRREYKQDNHICDSDKGPTQEEFQTFFEQVYNPQDVEPLDPTQFNTNVFIPIQYLMMKLHVMKLCRK